MTTIYFHNESARALQDLVLSTGLIHVNCPDVANLSIAVIASQPYNRAAFLLARSSRSRSMMCGIPLGFIVKFDAMIPLSNGR